MKFLIKKEDDDYIENGKVRQVLRISIGGPKLKDIREKTGNYCTFRGEVNDCIELLEHSLDALKKYSKIRIVNDKI